MKRLISSRCTLAMWLVHAGILTLLASTLCAQAETAGSVWDGVYSETQAARGAQVYGERCAACHLANLAGSGQAPGLLGGQFISEFDGLTVADIFDRIRTTMPSDAPGRLARRSYADVLAYILKYNGFGPGEQDLDYRSEYLRAIRFDVSSRSSSHAALPDSAKGGVSRAASPKPRIAAGGGNPGGQSRVPPSDIDALKAANQASGVLSPAESDPRNVPNSQPNPYKADADFFKLPPGRTMGSSSAVAADSKGHVWVAERCGANDCAGSSLDPIMEFDAQGKFIKAFGVGTLLFPHGFYIDRHDNLWITDGHAALGKGADVLEFDTNGKILRTLGKPGVQGNGPDTFGEPDAVVVAANGDIFVSDGHEAGPEHNARIVKFDKNGKFLMQWGSHGVAAGHFEVPHCLALDNEGRLYVGDRWNNRIQVFDQNGTLLGILTQFGRPSGLYIDKRDTLYATDSESRAPSGYGYHPGWTRGIRIGNVSDGIVKTFIPDTDPDPDHSATSGGEGIWVDNAGAIYSAEVKQRAIVRYIAHGN